MEGREVLDLVRRYNVLHENQVYAYFEAMGWKPKAVGKQLKGLENRKRIVRNGVTKMVASNESAYESKEWDNLLAFDVLIDIMKRYGGISIHCLAEKSDYPARVVFSREGEIYDIIVLNEDNLNLANNIFSRKNDDFGKHFVIVSTRKMMEEVYIPNIFSFCIKKEGDKVEYYVKT